MNKKTQRKKHIIIIIISLAILLAFFCIYYFCIKKWIYNERFLDEHPIYSSKNMKYDGTSYNIDNYKITLEKYMYNKKSDIGNVIFSIRKEKFKDLKDKYNWKKNGFYIFTERFEIEESQMPEPKYIIKGDTLYIYGYIENILLDTLNPIYLYDKLHESDSPQTNYTYKIKSNISSYEYTVNNQLSIILSPFSVICEDNNYKDNKYDADYVPTLNVVLHYKNGKTLKIIDTDKAGLSFPMSGTDISTYENNSYRYRWIRLFNKPIELKNIDYITINGKKQTKYIKK